jgi:hypothetical protein
MPIALHRKLAAAQRHGRDCCHTRRGGRRPAELFLTNDRFARPAPAAAAEHFALRRARRRPAPRAGRAMRVADPCRGNGAVHRRTGVPRAVHGGVRPGSGLSDQCRGPRAGAARRGARPRGGRASAARCRDVSGVGGHARGVAPGLSSARGIRAPVPHAAGHRAGDHPGARTATSTPRSRGRDARVSGCGGATGAAARGVCRERGRRDGGGRGDHAAANARGAGVGNRCGARVGVARDEGAAGEGARGGARSRAGTHSGRAAISPRDTSPRPRSTCLPARLDSCGSPRSSPRDCMRPRTLPA